MQELDADFHGYSGLTLILMNIQQSLTIKSAIISKTGVHPRLISFFDFQLGLRLNRLKGDFNNERQLCSKNYLVK